MINAHEVKLKYNNIPCRLNYTLFQSSRAVCSLVEFFCPGSLCWDGAECASSQGGIYHVVMKGGCQ